MKPLRTKLITPILMAILTALLLSNIALAQEIRVPQPIGVENVNQLEATVRRVIGWIYVAFFILAVVFILLAAFNYLFSGGDPEKVGKAKNYIIYSAVAVAIALLAFGFSTIIASILGSSSGINP